MPTTAVASPGEPRAGGGRPWPLRAAVALAFLLPAAAAGAGEVAPGAAAALPRGKVILTVAGAIGEAGRGGPVDYTLDELERLGTADLVTETPFTPGAVRFTGVPLQRLLDAVGARGESIRATALNDYAVDLPLADTARRDALLATRVDGKPMPVRDKGPLWIVFPWRGNPELTNPLYVARSIWQLRKLEVR
jgi:hypothetical protein